MIYKGRNREHKGRLVSFFDLPEKVQGIFSLIKSKVKLELGEIDVYVFGSYLHGYWDEQSDYDVSVSIKENIVQISKKITNEIGVKVDIVYNKDVNNLILIP